MELQLKDKVVIVTGASAGIGRATAVALAQVGANVVLVARRLDRLLALKDELAAYPGKRLPIAGDVGEEDFASQIIRQISQTFGVVNVLINNAGIGQKVPLTAMPAADMRRLLNTNVLGLLYLTQTVVSQMKIQGYGHIINISSIVGQRPLPNMGLYCASKSAVNSLSRTMRLELRPFNIQVTIVYPGRTSTEFGEAILGKKGASPSSLGRVPPERVAHAILKAISTGKPNVYITWYDWAFTHLNRLFPGTTDWLVMHLAQRFS